MRVLIVNKFLYPNGGSETYIFGLGDALKKHGHAVQYFGMEHEGRCVGNAVGAYTADMDFHNAGVLQKLGYSFKTIYSKEARDKIRLVLDDFKPDVVHLNNFNYQLTPSVILEVVKWRKDTGRACRIIYTAHDYQLLCPNHMFNNPRTHSNCEKCIGGQYLNCVRGRCIHGSVIKSMMGAIEAWFWRRKGTYKYIDSIICCSEFMKSRMDTNTVFASKTVAKHNFIEPYDRCSDNGNKTNNSPYGKYVLYFGRFSWEKGVRTLIEACKNLPDINFVFAGTGEYSKEIDSLPNAQNVGFKSGEELNSLIGNAEFSVCPSECYENCPFSVMESQDRLTPVLGAKIGGIPELIEEGKTGWLFESGSVQSLTEAISRLWNDTESVAECRSNLVNLRRPDTDEYSRWYEDTFGAKLKG
ncbi:glycosyltransferase [Butyrivibrio sp. FCS014]|uniref:glycosyltransferase n=1 Tax=Butyrivibrio sp. FCS014 TaxID=1408304 RepID=UPI000467BBD1|nr:glycosyltransferase [Butyrivibrio sp. FCS014]